MIGIAKCHREMAKVIYMSMDKAGNLIIGPVELKILNRLLRENLELVQRLDGLNNLAFIAHVSNDLAWEQEICRQIDELEAKMI